MTTTNDSELALESQIRAAQGGDAVAFEAVFERSYDTLYRYAFKWAGNAEDAEDIAQLAAIKLAKTLSQFRFESQFSTWVYRLVVNTAIDWQRANKRHKEAQGLPEETTLASVDVGAADSGFNRVYLQQLIARISTMGEGFREAVVLVLGEGFSHREAAQVLQVKESTISWRIHEVRKVLTKQENQFTAGGRHD